MPVAVDRPTFHESWYRVAKLRPRLRTTVQTYRQHFRGQRWHVVQDPSNNQFFRLGDAAYHFVGLLDGRRSVQKAWWICQELFGDDAPTQGEVMNLLGQLYTSNLLQFDLPPDAASMFENQRRRVRREISGFLMNILFLRIPLFDPDAFLERWERFLGGVFSPIGFGIWLFLIASGLYALIARADEFGNGVSTLLAPDNLFLLYLSFAAIKALHELGHGIATKRIGRMSGSGGEVHSVGVTLLVLTPVPYVDASSAWAFRNKWHRALVGAAGMYVELGVAALAAIAWANTSPGVVHSVAYNMTLVAGLSTLLFNGNPLLKFDGYYVLSDMLEVPNLAKRSREYLFYLANRYLYGAQQAVAPVAGRGEHWLPLYGAAATVYRAVLVVCIVVFISEKYFFLGMLFGATAAVTWILLPLGRFLRYLAADPALARVRPRAIAATAALAVVVLGGLGLVPVPDRARAEGVVESIDLARVYMQADGFVQSVLPSGRDVAPGGPPLLVARNVELETKRERLLAERQLAKLERDRASVHEFAVAQSLTERLGALEDQIEQVDRQLRSLSVPAPLKGRWISPGIEQTRGVFLERGEPIGVVASVDRLFIRVVADQRLGPRLEPEIGRGGEVRLRVRGRPDLEFRGRIREILPAGSSRLPSAALGYLAGGSTAVAAGDESGTTAIEPFFEVHIEPASGTVVPALFTGQRVLARFEMPARPLLVQCWRGLRRLVQQRIEMGALHAGG